MPRVTQQGMHSSSGTSVSQNLGWNSQPSLGTVQTWVWPTNPLRPGVPVLPCAGLGIPMGSNIPRGQVWLCLPCCSLHGAQGASEAPRQGYGGGREAARPALSHSQSPVETGPLSCEGCML